MEEVASALAPPATRIQGISRANTTYTYIVRALTDAPKQWHGRERGSDHAVTMIFCVARTKARWERQGTFRAYSRARRNAARGLLRPRGHRLSGRRGFRQPAFSSPLPSYSRAWGDLSVPTASRGSRARLAWNSRRMDA